jgi:hypothetical protein
MRRSMTYGVLPTVEEFGEAFSEEVDGGVYRIKSGLTPLPGNADGEHTMSELWELVKKLAEGSDEEMSVASDILSTLGFEWI